MSIKDVRVDVLDEELPEYTNLLKLALLQHNEFTLLPELLDIFGYNKFLKFIDIFSGVTIKVPNAKLLEHLVRDITIYIRLKNPPKLGSS